MAVTSNASTFSQDDLDTISTGSVDIEYTENSLSVASDETGLSATQLAADLNYAIVWEILNNCEEAAFSDIPTKYRDCLTIFHTKQNDPEGEYLSCRLNPIDDDKIFQVAGATKTTAHSWSLPAPARLLSDEDGLQRRNVRVAEVSQVSPTAAIYLAPNTTLADAYLDPIIEARFPLIDLSDLSDTRKISLSPLVHPTEPLFASAVFTSASHISPNCRKVPFQALRRYNRLATASLLRQTHSLHIDVPVFGVLLHENLLAIHVDWYDAHDGTVAFYSAFYPLDDEETGLKTWDLSNPLESIEVLTILSNLRTYTSGLYASRVHHGLKSVGEFITPWKWDASALPQTLSSRQLQRRFEEPAIDKMARWQKSLELSTDNERDNVYSKRRIVVRRLEQGVYENILSPPSTPGDA